MPFVAPNARGLGSTVVEDGSDSRAIDDLHGLVVETQRRAGFPLPPLERYRVAWRALAGAGRAAILEARRDGELLASGMVVFEGTRSYYLFSGSRREERGEPKHYASYALQWAMMRLARDRGVTHHDLWGVAPPGAGPDHAWHGVGLFKKGFGGERGGVGRQLGPGRGLGRLPPAHGDRHAARLAARASPMTEERRMGLGALTDVVGPERVIGIPVGEVTALAYDSRAVVPGTLFFAVPGVHVDGHEFAAAAVEAGAIGVVVEHELPGIAVPQLVVDRTRRALADAADEWFGRPSEQLKVIGVTGTDGKSTVTALTAEMLWGCRWHPGQIGTVFTGIFDDLEPNLAAQHDAGGARAPGAACPHGRRRQRQRGHGGHIAWAGAGADAQQPLRRRRGDDGDQRASRVPRHARELSRGQGAPGRGGADRRAQRR